jgi:transaldolase
VQIYLDSADPNEIVAASRHGRIQGVTTNPTLICRAGLSRAQFRELVRTVAPKLRDGVFVQVTEKLTDAIVEEALALVDLATGKVIPKIPVTAEGLAATARLSAQGIPSAATAVYTRGQVLMADLHGASYAIPYLGRLNDVGQQGLSVIQDMQAILRARGSRCRLVVGSVRTTEDLEALAVGSIDAATVSYRLYCALAESPWTEEALAVFDEDWRNVPP